MLLCQWHSEQPFLFWVLLKPPQQASAPAAAGLLRPKQLSAEAAKELLPLLALLLGEIHLGLNPVR